MTDVTVQTELAFDENMQTFAANNMQFSPNTSGYSPTSDPAYNGSNATRGGQDMWSNFDIDFYVYVYKIFTPIIFVIIAVIGTVGNGIVIFVILSNKKMRSSLNLLLLNLAFGDIIFMVVCMPFMAYAYAAETWVMGDIVCKVQYFLQYATIYVTVYTLLVISVVRYVIIVHTYSSARCRTKKAGLVVIALIWVFILALTSPTLMIYKVKSLRSPMYDPYQYCAVNMDIGPWLFVFFFITAYCVPLLGIFLLYFLILRYLRKKDLSKMCNHKNETNGTERATSPSLAASSKRTSHTMKVVATVVTVFALCWLPMHIHLLVAYLGKQPQSLFYELFRIMCHVLAYANSAMNPIIYNCVSRDFRKGFKKVFGCCRCRAKEKESVAENSSAQERLALNSCGQPVSSEVM